VHDRTDVDPARSTTHAATDSDEMTLLRTVDLEGVERETDLGFFS
jgi:hypothetical protein